MWASFPAGAEPSARKNGSQIPEQPILLRLKASSLVPLTLRWGWHGGSVVMLTNRTGPRCRSFVLVTSTTGSNGRGGVAGVVAGEPIIGVRHLSLTKLIMEWDAIVICRYYFLREIRVNHGSIRMVRLNMAGQLKVSGGRG